MKFADINKRYTEIVSEYIANGYTINAGTMRGSQGEIAHIDFTDGNDIVRVLVERVHDWRNGDFVQIVVGKCNENVKINREDVWDTVWNNRIDVIQCEKFYELGEDRKSGIEYGTKEESEKAHAKKMDRYDRSSEDVDLTHKYPELAKQIAKRVFNKKKISNDDVKLFRRGNGYFVSYKCTPYKLK